MVLADIPEQAVGLFVQETVEIFESSQQDKLSVLAVVTIALSLSGQKSGREDTYLPRIGQLGEPEDQNGVVVTALEIGGVVGVFDIFQDQGVEKIGIHGIISGGWRDDESIVEMAFQPIPVANVG
jgi:hypothetical protein